MPLVVDASALVFATTETEPPARDLRQRLADDACHAPHLIDAELGNVLRRKVRRGELVADHAEVLLAHAPRLVDHRYDHRGPLAAAAWALRNTLSFYDALYVAVAAGLDLPLVTLDERLARAPGLPCRVELVAS